MAPTAVARAQQLSKPVIVHEPATEAHLMAALEEQHQRQQRATTNPTAACTSNDNHHHQASGGIMGLLSSALGRNRQDGGGSSGSAAAARPIVIVAMFTASWCGPCTLVHREIARVPALFTQQEQVDLRVMVLDAETNAPLASRLGIHSLPTLLFLGPDASKPPILTQGYVSDRMIRDTAVRSAQFAGCNLHAKPVRL